MGAPVPVGASSHLQDLEMTTSRERDTGGGHPMQRTQNPPTKIRNAAEIYPARTVPGYAELSNAHPWGSHCE